MELNEAEKKQLETIENAIKENPQDFTKIIESNTTAKTFSKFYERLKDINENLTFADAKQAEQEKNRKFLLSKKYNNWTVKRHKDYSETYTTLNSFFPKGYNDLIELEPQTLCTIPARTGHGKTALMINLMLDAIEQRLEAENESKTITPIVFLSLEMTSEQIGKRIITNRIKFLHDKLLQEKYILPLPDNSARFNLYDYMIATDKLDELEKNGHTDRKHNIETLEKRLRKNLNKIIYSEKTIKDEQTGQETKVKGEEILKALDECYYKALERIEFYEQKGLYFLTDTESVSRKIKPDATEQNESIKDFLKNFPNSIIFIDYLQLIESPENYTNAWQSIKSICSELKESAQANNQIIITGAQFNREGFSGDFAHPQQLELSKIREGADIEHISNTVFAIAKAPDKKGVIKFYWKLLKRRDGENNYEAFFYDDDLMYCTLRPTQNDAKELENKQGKKQNASSEIKDANNTKTNTNLLNIKKLPSDKNLKIYVNVFLKDKYGESKQEKFFTQSKHKEYADLLFNYAKNDCDENDTFKTGNLQSVLEAADAKFIQPTITAKDENTQTDLFSTDNEKNDKYAKLGIIIKQGKTSNEK